MDAVTESALEAPWAAAPVRARLTRQLAGVVTGNGLEFYDFLSFGFFAVNLARVMFPKGAPGTALLLTVMTGSLGFFARPAGALVFGLLGDRLGRRPIMLTTFIMMGVGALGLALTPTYAQIGLAAPILVVAFRMVQGLAAGGDVGPTTAYLAESAPLSQRGLITSLQLAAMRLGVLAAGLVGLAIAWAVPPRLLDGIGWRLAFGLGAAIVPFAFRLRRRLDETLFLPEADPYAPTRIEPWLYVCALAGVFGALVMAGISDFLYTYAVTWLKTPSRTAFWLTVALGGEQVLFAILGGWLADRYGRRMVKLVPWLVGAALTLPVYGWIAQTGEFRRLVAGALLLAALSAIGLSAAYVALVEITPKKWRSGAIGIGYGLIVATAFGLGPPIITNHINHTGDLRSPGYLYLLGFLVGLASAALTPETHPVLRHARSLR